ncbi:serine/threonine-protein kinase [Micromonospora sagamiensis]|uniref:non-specific serine/threonine protein kinase n=1 Tax=Micromonospora sagamiensis TaxID=47875 RepID=A0A562WEB8_9ACTN|nr:serine/threonine-protein kinase [Micromonospora sagamiensis]TWJ28633.1 serine/threonine-protein kinase [Micromonospora sagamiensis]BCL12462.1 hypothetical protein GCM10017556_02010 [Micromonospora sagamiensis]
MLRPGLRLNDRYRLDARIGAGGMGEVWRAVDEVLGRVVAVKAMLPDVAGEPDFARRFLVEAKAMASVNHPAVASIHDYGHSDGLTFLVMEFIEGHSLSQILASHGRLTPADTMHLVAQAAEGLQAVHDCGIVHRDIKPANLLVRRNGSLLITDFGISRHRDATNLTVSGVVLGTPTYLSPEQVLGQPATALSDVYSLGLAAYECLAGHRPFAGDNPYAVALQRVQAAPRALGDDVPPPVRAVIERALTQAPADRWPSAAALAGAARAAANGMPGHPLPPPAAPPVAAPAPGAPVAPPGPLPVAPVAASGPVTVPPVADRPVASARRRWSLVAGATVLALVGGITAWQTIGDGGSRAGAGPTPDTTPSAAPAGFVACGATLCPTSPLCWDGLVAISGNAMRPRKADCAGEHSWETFAATRLPADAVDVPQDDLMAHPVVTAACSASVMASRSADRSATAGWVRDAWPVQISGTDVWLVHCLARPETGDPSGSAFSTP